MHNIENIQNCFLEGDVMEQLALIPDESVECCITSPPYWKLRNYSVAGQLGQEPTIQEYVKNITKVFINV